MTLIKGLKATAWDERKDLMIPGDYTTTLTFCVGHFISLAKNAIIDHNAFYVALSGGSTPQALFEKLSAPPYAEAVPWEKCHFFWSDERAVAPDHPESNYGNAMHAGLDKMPIPQSQIHRMHAENDIEENARAYQAEIKETLQGRPFDFIMLGMGEDGHTASLFPETKGLVENERLVIANHVPQKKTWRMSLTFRCINEAHHTAIYVLGASKKHPLATVLLSKKPELYPVLNVGTPERHALWIVDEAAAAELPKTYPRVV